MTQQQDHLNQLNEIKNLMERSSRFLSLSGLSGVFAGIFALIGAFIAYWYFGFNFNFLDLHSEIYDSNGFLQIDFLVFGFTVAIAVLFLSLVFALWFSYRKAKKNHLKFWDKNAIRVLFNMMIPLSTGGLLGIIMIFQNQLYYISGITLIFYGLALVNSSKYTFNDIRYLGIFEIVLGLLASVYIGYGLIFWAIGFGVLHIVYGLVMYFKYDR